MTTYLVCGHPTLLSTEVRAKRFSTMQQALQYVAWQDDTERCEIQHNGHRVWFGVPRDAVKTLYYGVEA